VTFRKRLGKALLMAGIAPVMLAAAADNQNFHNAPAAVKNVKSPLAGQAGAVQAGGKLFLAKCRRCHGTEGQGGGNTPALTRAEVRAATDGELFWFIANGSEETGMPAWDNLSDTERWQLVAFVRSLGGKPASPAPAASTTK